MDFPRGKLPPGSGINRRKRSASADVLFKKSDNHDDEEKKKSKRRRKKNDDAAEEDSKVVIEAISMKMLPINTTIIGCICKITDYEITMVIAGGGMVSVPIYNISDVYSELVEDFVSDPSNATPFKPQSMFEVGQCLPVKILEKNTGGKIKGTKVIGSINPKNLYSEFHPQTMKTFASSIIISATVTGIEDHGYVMDIGLGSQVTGFLGTADARGYLKRRPQMNRIPIGCVVLCAGISMSSRVLRLSTKEDQLNQNIVTGDTEVIPLTSVVPGLKVSARVMDISDRGLEIIVANEHKGYIHRDHLRSEWEMPDKNYAISNIVECRVLFVHPVSQLVVCSLRDFPDPESVKTKFSNLSPGKVILDAKVALFDERGNMILMTKKDKVKLLATRNCITDEPMDETKMIQEYPVGSKQKCKVLSLNYLDQLVRVSLKPSFVEQEYISHEDIAIGQIFTGKVKNLSNDGLYIKLCPGLVGFARNVHLADAPKVVHPEKMFPLDKEIKCRVLNMDKSTEPVKITVTCKKSLISKKLNILDSIEKAVPGFETLGTVVLANKSGVLLEFFGGLQGWISRILLTDYVNIERSFVKGQIVKCYVISSDPKSGRINLSLNNSETTRVEDFEIVEKDSTEIVNDEPGKLEAGSIVSGKVTKIDEDGLVLELSNDVSTKIPLTQVIDSQYINKREIERRFAIGQEVSCRIISKSQDGVEATMKPSLLSHAVEVWKSYSTLQVGMSSLGVVSKVMVRQGRIVTFIGGVRGFLKEKLVATNTQGYKAGKLQPGELVACKLINIDPGDKKVSLDLISMESFRAQSTPEEKPVTSGFSFDKLGTTQEADESEIIHEEEGVTTVEQTIEKRVKTLREKEAELRRKETRLANKELKPETIEEHERKVVSEPNSCIGWLDYMTYHLECKEIDKARAVAERALNVISFREENEKFNIWVALINLEHFYGDRESLEKVIGRARQVNDPVKIDLRIAKMYQEANETELAEQVYESMMKKSKHDKTYWVDYGMFFMKMKRFEAARDLMKKSFNSLPNRDHLDVISKFAQMEFKIGQIEQGKTLFESILVNYPKRTDVWLVYLSMLIKYTINHEMPSSDELEFIRTTFERLLSMGLNSKKANTVFKKYLEFEEAYGNSSKIEALREKSMKYVEGNKLQSFME